MFYKLDLKNPASHIRELMAIGSMPADWDNGGIMSLAIRLLASALVLIFFGMIFCIKFWRLSLH